MSAAAAKPGRWRRLDEALHRNTRLQKVEHAPFMEIEVSLVAIRPPVVRGFLLRRDATVQELHEAIADASGGFVSRDRPWPSSTAFPDFEEPIDGARRADDRLAEIFIMPGDRIGYFYKTGDSWKHLVRLQQTGLHPARSRRKFLEGSRVHPPEGCHTYELCDECVEASRDKRRSGRRLGSDRGLGPGGLGLAFREEGV